MRWIDCTAFGPPGPAPCPVPGFRLQSRHAHCRGSTAHASGGSAMDVTSFVQSAPAGVFAFMVIFLLLMAGVAGVAGLHARRRAALIEKTDTSPIGFAEDGYREFEGTIEAAAGELAAPLTGWPCVWYASKVERYVVSSRQRTGSKWEEVRSGSSDAPFLVRDSTGAAIVRPWGAEVTPTDLSVWYGSTAEPEDRNPAAAGADAVAPRDGRGVWRDLAPVPLHGGADLRRRSAVRARRLQERTVHRGGGRRGGSPGTRDRAGRRAGTRRRRRGRNRQGWPASRSSSRRPRRGPTSP